MEERERYSNGLEVRRAVLGELFANGIEIREGRREMARLMTVLTEKERKQA